MRVPSARSGFALACAVAMVWTHGSSARAELAPADVLLLYNSLDDESLAIRDAYVAAHPDVVQVDLQIDYSEHLPANGPDDPGPDAISNKHITPEAFVTYVTTPLRAFLARDPAAAGVISIVTTRGLPATITTDFTPSAHGPEMISGFEAQLARLGYVDAVEDISSQLNPYRRRLNLPFREFLADTCPNGGSAHAGKLFLVSRLDSSPLGGDALAGVQQLIERSVDPTVNKFATTLVLDDIETCSLLFEDRRAFGTMCEAGWCVAYDNTQSFLHGVHDPGTPGCGGWDPDLEGQYTDYPELVHAGAGKNHHNYCNPFGTEDEAICGNYVQHYGAHPAGFFNSLESYNGWSIHRDQGLGGHGRVLDWIPAGGAFTCGNVKEPGIPGALKADYVMVNLYEHGLSWGEAVYTSLSFLGQWQTPIGDPLATVTVHDPDVDGDLAVDTRDLLAVKAQWGPCPDPPASCDADINRDGIVDIEDLALVNEAFGRDCSDQVCLDPLVPATFRCNSEDLGWLCQGDLNGDFVVDVEDLILLLGLLGCACPDGDINGDGFVNVLDLIDLLLAWGPLDHLADIDGSGSVECTDFALFQAHYDDYDPAYDLNCDGRVNILDSSPVFYHLGDVNGDGAIDCADVDRVRNHVLRQHPYDPDLDFDCDGVVDLDDIEAIKWGLAFLEPPVYCLPQGCGAPDGGSCFGAHPWGGCADGVCCELVIDTYPPFECEEEWSSLCALAATVLCEAPEDGGDADPSPDPGGISQLGDVVELAR